MGIFSFPGICLRMNFSAVGGYSFEACSKFRGRVLQEGMSVPPESIKGIKKRDLRIQSEELARYVGVLL